jgi:hypothetical protein
MINRKGIPDYARRAPYPAIIFTLKAELDNFF